MSLANTLHWRAGMGRAYMRIFGGGQSPPAVTNVPSCMDIYQMTREKKLAQEQWGIVGRGASLGLILGVWVFSEVETWPRSDLYCGRWKGRRLKWTQWVLVLTGWTTGSWADRTWHLDAQLEAGQLGNTWVQKGPWAVQVAKVSATIIWVSKEIGF